MNPTEQQRYNNLYQQHLTNLTLQGKRPATIDAYSRAVRRISEYFDRSPDTLTTDELKTFFASLIKNHSWSTVKLDRNGLQFFYRYTLDKQWQWLNIVKPPQVKRLPDILTPASEGLWAFTRKCQSATATDTNVIAAAVLSNVDENHTNKKQSNQSVPVLSARDELRWSESTDLAERRTL
jgi:site-specific recombinase XerD